ncbi:MAG: scyllo-inositol 2-dehydrogenase [Clostridiales bacterium]|jgi:predicted dehydrogenase|nr:scyllo-inositol 2-dehydrogenase [Clostridiales bacterium]MDN5298694.1 scyllo-inositol 2-dehydrogenase [Clostridiales bacterium]
MKLAVVGTGSIVDTFIQATEGVDRIAVTTVYSRDFERGKAIAKRYGIHKVETNFDALMADKAVDTLYLALPNSLHYDFALKALAAGKHVIVEKPFTGTLEQAEHLFEMADAHDKMVAEAMSVPFQPVFTKVKALLPKLGTIKLVQAQYSQRSSRYDRFVAGELPNIFNPKFEGGALMDLNVYNLGFITRLFGMPNEGSYYANRAENGVDTSGIAVLKYNGFTATAIAAKDSEGESFAIIQGDEGYLKIEGPVSVCRKVTHFNSKGECLASYEDNAENRLHLEAQSLSEMIDLNEHGVYDIRKYETLETMRVIALLKSHAK